MALQSASLALVVALACGGCGGQSPAEAAPEAPTVRPLEAPRHGAAATRPVITAVAPAPSATTAPAPAAAPPPGRSIGDSTCSRDEECTVTTESGTCDCCAGAPAAAAVKWLKWWTDYKTTKGANCHPCSTGTCAPVQTTSGLRAVCVARGNGPIESSGGTCTLASDSAAGLRP